MNKTFTLRPLAAALLSALFVAPGVVHALPQGGAVAGGSVSAPSTVGNTMTVTQNSASAIMNWQSFSVAANERVNFIQPSASATILNRVVGSDPSSIFGQISANGRVFLVNPNGVVFGAGSRIDAAGLVASTSNISNANFMAGNYVFDEVTNRTATIVNHGEITVAQGGLVALVAPGVANSGVIRADLGRVALASGNAFTLDLFGDKLVSFAVGDKVAGRLTDVEGNALTAYVSNTGEISANGGSVLLAANVVRDVVDNAINLGGIVRANSVAQRNGEIVLFGGDGVVNINGIAEAKGNDVGSTGGSITVTGRELTLTSSSLLDASGNAGGGTILVGGGFQGSGPLAHADTIRVETGAALRADGGETGNGGTVVLWSDGHTDFNGSISAMGGSRSGNGGLVEVSSKGGLDFYGTVALGAPKGNGGRLYLDPSDMAIGDVAAQTISFLLLGGSSVTASASNNMTLYSNIVATGGTGSLTLTAGNVMDLQAGISTGGNVSLTASSIKLRYNITAGTTLTFNGDVYVNPMSEIVANTGSGLITASSASSFATQMAGIAPFAGGAANAGTPVFGQTVKWDPVSTRATLTATNIVFNKSLLWGGTQTANITDPSQYLQFQYYKGEVSTTERSALALSGTRYFILKMDGAVNFAGTGKIGFASTPTIPGDNPGNAAVAGAWCENGGVAAGLALTATSVTGGGGYTINNGLATVGDIAGSTSAISLVGNGFGGAFSTPNPTAPLASGLSPTLSNIALPNTNIVNVNDAEKPANEDDSGGGKSVTDMAGLGRGGSAASGDPFSEKFQLVGGSGDFGGQPYFTASVFDFAANKSKSGRKDDDRR